MPEDHAPGCPNAPKPEPVKAGCLPACLYGTAQWKHVPECPYFTPAPEAKAAPEIDRKAALSFGDSRNRCTVCEGVMHGSHHYGSSRTHALVLALKQENERLEGLIVQRITCGYEKWSGDLFDEARAILAKKETSK